MRVILLIALIVVAGCRERPPRNIAMETKCLAAGGQVEDWHTVNLDGSWTGHMACAKKGSKITEDSRRFLFFWP
jgi:hypothetical protein